jgi:hypothetical protein
LMRFVYTVLAGSIFLVLFSCRKNPELRTSSSVSWKNCTLVDDKTDDVKVCLDSLIGDSRCPLEVVCIWQGTAIAKFSVTVNDHQQPVTLSTFKLPGFPSDTILMGYKIEFVDLLPYPDINKSHDISEYRAELKITKQ